MFIKEVDKVFLKSEYSMRFRGKKRSAVRKTMNNKKKRDKNKSQNLKALKGGKKFHDRRIRL